MSRIFINYRRHSASGHTGRLYDRLVQHFGSDNVFMDIEIPLGADFVAYMTDMVQQCDVLLALIDRDWLTITDEAGTRRLDKPDDFVRLEIRAALSRDIPVIPIYVQDASPPPEELLSEDIKALGRRQGLYLSDLHFHSDVDRLIRALNDMLKNCLSAPRQEIYTTFEEHRQLPEFGQEDVPTKPVASLISRIRSVTSTAFAPIHTYIRTSTISITALMAILVSYVLLGSEFATLSFDNKEMGLFKSVSDLFNINQKEPENISRAKLKVTRGEQDEQVDSRTSGSQDKQALSESGNPKGKRNSLGMAESKSDEISERQSGDEVVKDINKPKVTEEQQSRELSDKPKLISASPTWLCNEVKLSVAMGSKVDITGHYQSRFGVKQVFVNDRRIHVDKKGQFK